VDIATSLSRRSEASRSRPTRGGESITVKGTWQAEAMSGDETRHVVITGANTGIGLETAVALARGGDHVVIACRNPTKAEHALGEIRARSGSDLVDSIALDLSSFDSIRYAVNELESNLPCIDVLINNAGLILSKRTTTTEGFETQFGVNHLGHFLLTTLLRDKIVAADAPRVINLSSMGHWGAIGGLAFGDLQSSRFYNGWLTYCRSKLANILFTQELSTRWKADGVVSNALHPGVVRSEFGKDGDTGGISKLMVQAGEVMTITPEQGAQTSIHLATSREAGQITGRYWASSKVARTAPWAKRPGEARRLWEESERLVKLGRPD